MKTFPLETLLRTREHRERRALQEVSEQRIVLGQAVAAMNAVQSRFDELVREDVRLASRLAEGASLAECGVDTFTTIDKRRALVRERAAAVNEELRAASARVDEERRKLADRLLGYRRARAKKDSADLQRDRWQAHEKMLNDRRDEHAADEYNLSRYFSTERSL